MHCGHSGRGPRRLATRVALASLSIPASVTGQVTFRSTGAELGHVFEDVGYFWASPLRAAARDWAAAGLVSAGFVALLPVDERIDRWIVAHPRAAVFGPVAPFREGNPLARLAMARELIPISAALTLAGSIADRRELREAGYGCIAAWGASNTVRYTIYAGISRLRPSAANGDALRIAVPGGEWDENSFFAGHATNGFACASFWSERFDLSFGEPVLYAAAALTALARMADRRHWASDTFVGVAVGFAIGHAMAGRYDRRAERREARSARDVTQRGGARALPPGPAPVVILWRASF